MTRFRPIRLSVVMGLLALASHAHAMFYDPFPDAASVKPSDELEDRIWQEAEVTKGQFVRAVPSAHAQALAEHARKLLKRQWPDLASKIRIDVIDNADVLALSSANGDIIISTGMFMRLDNEQELAAILAREIGHVMKRHAVRSVYVARLGAGANTVFQSAVNASSFMGAVSIVSSLSAAPQILLADGGKALMQSQLTKIRDNMADNFLRRMSATGFEAMVKTSLFGYSEGLEAESDEFALTLLDQAYGQTDAFKRVMQRLADEAAADEKKFSAFYGNEVRMRARLEAQADFDKQKAKRASSSPSTGGSAAHEHVATPAGDVAQPALVQLHADSIVIEATQPIVAVVVGDVDDEDSAGDRPLAAVFANELPPLPSVLNQIAMSVFESELDAGHLGRLVKNIERPREGVKLPPKAQLILAESLWAMPDAQQVTRGESLAAQYIQNHPEDAAGLKLLGLMMLKRGDAAKAESYLEQALKAAETEDERGFILQYLQQAQKKKVATAS
ncbi:MAG: M48 family metalloprotease [Aquabacterium sp.]|nr:M48 family metalloprotease [Aquabacterium sp.]